MLLKYGNRKEVFLERILFGFCFCTSIFLYYGFFNSPIRGLEVANTFFLKGFFFMVSNNLFGLSLLISIFGGLYYYGNLKELKCVNIGEKNSQNNFQWKICKISDVPRFIFFVLFSSKEWQVYLLYIILIFSFLWKASLIGLIGNPYHDEGFHILQMQSMHNGNFLPFFDSGRIEFRGLTYVYLSFILSFFTDSFLVAIRLSSVIYSLFATVLLYLILKHFFNKSVAVLVVIIFSFNAYVVAFSLLGRFYTEAIFFMFLFIYLFFVKDYKSNGLKLVLGIFSFLAFFFNILLIPILGLKELINKRYKDFYVSVLIVLLILIIWKGLLDPLALVEGTMKNDTSNTVIQISLNVNEQQLVYYKNLLGVILIFFIFSLFFLLNKRFRKQGGLYIYIIIFSFFILALFSTNWYNVRYILNAYILMSTISLSVIIYILHLFSRINNNHFLWVYIIGILGMTIFTSQIYSSFNGVDLYLKNSYFLKNYFAKDIESNQSILLASSAVNNVELINVILHDCERNKCVLFTTDIYNTVEYFKYNSQIKVFIINKFLFDRGGYVYLDGDGKIRCVYTNEEYVYPSVASIGQIEEQYKGRDIYFITKVWKLKDQNKGEISEHFINNYSVILETPEVYIGNYGNQSYEKYMLLRLNRY